MNFPLPPVPDPLLPLVNLNFQTARELCKFLDRDDNCKILLDYLLAKLPPGARVVTQSGVNGETFLNFLKNRLNGTVKDLDFMLEQCSLEEPLYLFREQTPVEIIIQPTSQITLINGQSNAGIDLEINSNAFPKPRFQWFFQPEGCDAPLIQLNGKISQTLIFPIFSPSDVGLYFCQIQQKCRDGTDRVLTSRTVSLSMEQFAPNISLQPEDRAFHVHDQIELKCCAEAYPSPTYQWSKNNVDLPGEVHSNLLISTASLDHSGYYSCLISNTLGAVVTREARILVNKLEPLRIITQPVFPNDAPVREGSIINLECKAVSGMSSIYYQWVCNQTELQGQTNRILSILALPLNGATTLQFYCNIWTDLEGDEIQTQVASTRIDTSVISQEQHTASMKMALLIGNWTYKNMDRLEMVRPDIKSFRDILYPMGFEVIAFCNLAKNEIRTAVNQFCDLLLPGAYVVVYFAGHGIYNFGDYIVPVDAPSDSQYTLDDLISVNEIISHVQNKQPKLLTFLLDTCRTIPERNVTPASYEPLPMDSRTNLILGYATSENHGAYEMRRSQNGVFMTFFKQEIKKPKIFIDVALKNVQKRFKTEVHDLLPDQIPQVTSFLGEDLSLHDPIDRPIIGTGPWNNFLNTSLRWNVLPQSPISGSIQWNDSTIDVTVEFMQMDNCFLNALTIELKFDTFEDEPFTLIPIVRPQCLEILQTVQEFPRYSVTIHKLQTLTEDAVIRFRVAGIDRDVLSIDLGRPLISSVPRFYEPVNML